jgi:hypothetical protein
MNVCIIIVYALKLFLRSGLILKVTYTVRVSHFPKWQPIFSITKYDISRTISIRKLILVSNTRFMSPISSIKQFIIPSEDKVYDHRIECVVYGTANNYFKFQLCDLNKSSHRNCVWYISLFILNTCFDNIFRRISHHHKQHISKQEYTFQLCMFLVISNTKSHILLVILMLR